MGTCADCGMGVGVDCGMGGGAGENGGCTGCCVELRLVARCSISFFSAFCFTLRLAYQPGTRKTAIIKKPVKALGNTPVSSMMPHTITRQNQVTA